MLYLDNVRQGGPRFRERDPAIIDIAIFLTVVYAARVLGLRQIHGNAPMKWNELATLPETDPMFQLFVASLEFFQYVRYYYRTSLPGSDWFEQHDYFSEQVAYMVVQNRIMERYFPSLKETVEKRLENILAVYLFLTNRQGLSLIRTIHSNVKN